MSDTLAIEYVKLARKVDRLTRKLKAMERAPVKLADDAAARLKDLEARVQSLAVAASARPSRPSVDVTRLPGMPIARVQP